MRATLRNLIVPTMALGIVAGCAAQERYWPLEVERSANAASVQRGSEAMTVIARLEDTDDGFVSPEKKAYYAALLRAARETRAAGQARFEVVDTDAEVLTGILGQVGPRKSVRYEMTVRPLAAEGARPTGDVFETAEVLAGPEGGRI